MWHKAITWFKTEFSHWGNCSAGGFVGGSHGVDTWIITFIVTYFLCSWVSGILQQATEIQWLNNDLNKDYIYYDKATIDCIGIVSQMIKEVRGLYCSHVGNSSKTLKMNHRNYFTPSIAEYNSQEKVSAHAVLTYAC